MEHALVVIDGKSDPTDLVREAGELAAGVDARLTLLYVTTESEYEKKRETLSEYLDRSDTHYTLDEALQGARSFVSDLGVEVLVPLDVDYEVESRFGNVAEEVLSRADELEVDHLFIAGQRRSPVGKAVFGDSTQQIILNFDGFTTVFSRL